MSTTSAFWRDTPLTAGELTLFLAVMEAHRQSALRDNLSSVALKLAAAGSGDFCKSVTAALSTLGGLHGPIVATMDFLRQSEPEKTAAFMVHQGAKIPGWGNSFVKGAKDRIWAGVDRILTDLRPDPGLSEKLEAVTDTLHRLGKNIFPNPSAYTAAAAIVLRIPVALSPYLLVCGRLDGWADLFCQQLKQKT